MVPDCRCRGAVGTLSGGVGRLIACLCVAVGLVTVVVGADPAEATADITASSISSPADGSALFYDGDNGSGSVEVSGTVAGAGAGTHADLVCYDRSDSETFTLLSAADVSSG